jgi:hypothetical protein
MIAALLLAAGCGGEPCTAGWRALFEPAELDRPILSLWGAGDEVWAVGGPLGAPGLSSLVMRWDGARWTRPATGTDETLWWVWGTPDGRAVWMVGERGRVLRWDGERFETLESGSSATLYGVWGSAGDDVWIVGGTPGGGASAANDVVLHWDGARMSAPDAPAPLGAAFFKVWGAAAGDLWVAGEGGLMQRRTDSGWQRHDLPTRAAITTVHGCAAGDVWAVGGQAVFHWDGDRWAKDAVEPIAGANGVHCSAAEVLVVGNGGLKLRLDRTPGAPGTWRDDTFEPPFYDDFHAAWIDASGASWAAGGNYNAPVVAGRRGMLGHRGCPVPR